MKIVLAAVFLSVLIATEGQRYSISDTLDVNPSSERSVYNSLLNYIESSCLQDGTCDESIPEDVWTTEPHDVATEESLDAHRKSPYFGFCVKINKKFQELEALHPELAQLKFKLFEKLNSHAASFSLECKTGESLLLKLLDMMIFLAEKLKVDFAAHLHKKHVPVEVAPESVEEIIAEEADYGFVGSVRGIPGVHYPKYTEVPITSFSCSDKKYIPGFYADLETGCQVFHVCYEHRRESFLCPLGTTFNQPILACDYWYSSNCSQSPFYYDVNSKTEEEIVAGEVTHIDELITTIIEGKKPDTALIPIKPTEPIQEEDLKDLLKFLPVKAKVFEFPEAPIKAKFAAKTVAAIPAAKIAVVAAAIPVAKAKIVAAAIPVAKAKIVAAAIPVAKAKIVAAAIPVAKAKIVAAAIPVAKAKIVAAAIPVAKAKVVAAAIPVAKAKVVAAAIPVAKAKVVAAAIPVAKAKIVSAAIPVVKAKIVSSAVKAKLASIAAVPVAKKVISTKVASVAIPVVKSKLLALPMAKTKVGAVSVPILKAKVIPYVKMTAVKPKLAIASIKAKSVASGLPLVKAKLAKSVMISPLTKKALAVGYMKLLKAKKLALMG